MVGVVVFNSQAPKSQFQYIFTPPPVKCSFKDRTIEVGVGATQSRVYPTENGVPQGSVCSPLLFSIMINDIFSEVDASLGSSLYADDGALWVKICNGTFAERSYRQL